MPLSDLTRSFCWAYLTLWLDGFDRARFAMCGLVTHGLLVPKVHTLS